MQCPNCQAELAPGTTPCPHCGISIESEPTLTFVPVTAGAHPALTRDEAGHVAGFGGFALVVERGPQAGMTWVLPLGSTSVGRRPESEIFLDDVTVSRQHCRFVWDRRGLFVEDAGSTNGTYVNGDRVDRIALRPGDEVIIGKFHLLVALGDE